MMHIKDHYGNTIMTLEKPAIVYDTDTYILFRVGEAHIIKKYYKELIEETRIKSKQLGILDEQQQERFISTIFYMELPIDRDTAYEIEKLIYRTGYLKEYIRKLRLEKIV